MLVIDAGPLIAAASRRDVHHARCAELLATAAGPLVVPSLVVTEVAYFLADRVGPNAERAFAESLREGQLAVEPVEPEDWVRIVELLDRYADSQIGVVDASVIAACERLGETKLATLDHRHFGTVRPRHCEALELLPS